MGYVVWNVFEGGFIVQVHLSFQFRTDTHKHLLLMGVAAMKLSTVVAVAWSHGNSMTLNECEMGDKCTVDNLNDTETTI
jgi:hypothetical protein